MKAAATVAAVAVGGALGALARYGIGALITERTGAGFPWGTFVVNVSGAFVLGLLFAVVVSDRVAVAGWAQAGLTVGFLGAYTTFSTLALDTVLLAEDERILAAAANAAGTLVIGLIAVMAGLVLGRVLFD